MTRDLPELARRTYDVLVVGAGIYGACTAWDAILRGLSVALIERGDFGAATSANSLKIVHGGLRYLQHGDIRRVRESATEQAILMQVAPHLVRPLPVVVPTYGHGLRGRLALTLALRIHDLATRGCHHGDRRHRLPGWRLLTAAECRVRVPGVSRRGLTGGALFHEAQVVDSERLVLSFVRSASRTGARVANYVRARRCLLEGGRVVGVDACDVLTGDAFAIRARAVVNTTGPWVDDLVRPLLPSGSQRTRWAKAFNVITRRPLADCAIGIAGGGCRDADSLVPRGTRLLFATPWRDRALIGTAYAPYDGHPDALGADCADVQGFLNEVNNALPGVDLKMDDVLLVHRGLLPFSAVRTNSEDVQLAKRPVIRDHELDGAPGLISVTGVKYTTARRVAQDAIDAVFRARRVTPPPSRSAVTPVMGGDFETLGTYVTAEAARRPPWLAEETMAGLVRRYGSAYGDVVRYLEPPKSTGADGRTSELAVHRAETIHAVRCEMAQTLSDVVFRRTGIASAGDPPLAAVAACAEAMGEELGWSAVRTQQVVRDARRGLIVAD